MPSRSRSQATRNRSQPRVLEVVEIQQPTLNRRHDAPEPALAFEQRQACQILTLETQHVEGVEVRPLAADQKLVELRTPVRLQATNLAVQPFVGSE